MCFTKEEVMAFRAQGFSDAAIIEMAQGAANRSIAPAAVAAAIAPAASCTLVDPSAARKKGLRSITLTVTTLATTTGVFLDNALELFSPLGIVGANDLEFDVSGDVTVQAFKEYLKTRAIAVKRANYTSTLSTQLDNNIEIIEATIDGTSKNTTIDSAIDRLSSDNNPNLLNLRQPFVLTNERGLYIPTPGGVPQTIQLVLEIEAIPTYTELPGFVASKGCI